MGSFSVAYYTIAQFRLIYCGPALLSETKKRGVVGHGEIESATVRL